MMYGMGTGSEGVYGTLGLAKFQCRMAIMRIVAFSLVALVCLGGVSVGIEPCDASLTPIDNWALQYRTRGERCEGFYEAEISSGNTLEIVGLTLGLFSYALEEGVNVSLSCPLLDDASVHVRAVGIPLKMYYRMDAAIGPGQSLTWPLNDVLFPQQIPSDDVGVLAWLREAEHESASRVYVPVFTTTAAGQPASDERINLYVRSSVDVEAVQWRVSGQCEGICQEMSVWTNAERPAYRAGKPIRIELLPSGTERVCVEVAARNQVTGDWLKRSVVLVARSAKADE